MPGHLKQTPPEGFRLQGTDGIRAEVKLSSSPDLAGMSPQQVFLEHNVITDAFMELYAYAHVRLLIHQGRLNPGDNIVVGWDPRDPGGTFVNAVVRGVRKARANALVLGVVPTPLVPAYMLYKNAGGGLMVTASHNPKDQNGIKTFFAHRGMKLLPQNDIELTQAILKVNHKNLAKIKLSGKKVDARRDALEWFESFSLHPENSWTDYVSFKNIVLVVDPANGALTGFAARMFRRAGFGRVYEVNRKLNGDVNLNSGVADLEGHPAIAPSMIAKGSGAFSKHAAVIKVFELGRKHKKEILAGKRRVAGAVFDGDGDRFYRLDYNPYNDSLIVLSGDETAYLQAKYLMARNPEQYKNTAYINTVESDFNAGRAAEQLGLNLQLAAVGDKWILLRIAIMIAETHLKSLAKKAKQTKSRDGKRIQKAIPDLKSRLRKAARARFPDAHQFAEIEQVISRLEQQTHLLKTAPQGITAPLKNLPFAVGSEETGHNITLGWMETGDAHRVPLFCGNGLKSALNTFAATQYLLGNRATASYFSHLTKPFSPGYKKTDYAFYVKKERFHKNSAVWKRVKRCILAEAEHLGYSGKAVNFPEDPDMLYMSLKPSAAGKNSSRPSAAVFVRNSGTENKIGVNLRCHRRDAGKLRKVGEEVCRVLFTSIKDADHHYYKMELDILNQLATGLGPEQIRGRRSLRSRGAVPLPEHRIRVEPQFLPRLLMEMKKQNLIQLTPNGYRLTPRGQWYRRQTG